MVYVGAIERLRGLTAIVRESSLLPGALTAQFDSRDLGDLAYGWHFFEPTDFKEKEIK